MAYVDGWLVAYPDWSGGSVDCDPESAQAADRISVSYVTADGGSKLVASVAVDHPPELVRAVPHPNGARLLFRSLEGGPTQLVRVDVPSGTVVGSVTVPFPTGTVVPLADGLAVASRNFIGGAGVLVVSTSRIGLELAAPRRGRHIDAAEYLQYGCFAYMRIVNILPIFELRIEVTMRQLVITTPKQVGQILLARRKSLHLSQSQIASQLGISQSRVSTLEAQPESITLDRLIAYANLLGLELVVGDRSEGKPSPGQW